MTYQPFLPSALRYAGSQLSLFPPFQASCCTCQAWDVGRRNGFLHQHDDMFDIAQGTVFGGALGECALHIGWHKGSRGRGDTGGGSVRSRGTKVEIAG
jgi:hypothetical protein